MTRRLFVASVLLALSGHLSAATWEELVRNSREYANAQQLKLEADYDLSKHERWDLDQETGELVFSNKGKPAVVAKFQFVGSVSSTSNTWLWSWANRSIRTNLSTHLEVVRRYGEKNGFRKLTNAKWDAQEADGWEMAAIANYLLKGKGIYRPPFTQGVTFLVLTEIRRVSTP